MLEFSWYDGVDLKHPKKDAFTYINVYHQGEVLGKNIKKVVFDRSGFPKEALVEPIFDNNAYSVACSDYYKELSDRKDQFKLDLFLEFGVEDNPKREMCYVIAYSLAIDKNTPDLYNTFEDLVTLIRD